MEKNAASPYYGIPLSRRDFIRLSAISAAAIASGCAINPVTGESQLMLVSEDTEVSMDKTNSPHQFSADYGIVQDITLNSYMQDVGKKIAIGTHRPNMPYRFQAVNATYVNAYAFPGGSIAATRGILLSLDNEAELSALMGHELGHVNARHTAKQMSRMILAQAVVGGIGVYAAGRGSWYGQLAGQLGLLSAGALLASYSRDNEREADALGMDYSVNAGYGPQGVVGLMEMLNTLSKEKKEGTTGLLFATHPMSEDRYQAAIGRAQEKHKAAKTLPLFKERYMDHTVKLRAIEGAIKSMQQGEEAMARQKFPVAESQFEKALSLAPNDYAGLLMMAKCQLAQNKNREALTYAERAKTIYPAEAQAHHLSGFAKTRLQKFESALSDFRAYEHLLPGNPNTTFYTGYALEGMQRTEAAADAYKRYLKSVDEGAQAQHAQQRLIEWGYIKQQ